MKEKINYILKDNKNKKTLYTILILITILLIVIVFRVTYSYFVAPTAAPSETPVDVTTNKSSSALSFEAGTALALTPDSGNLGIPGTHLSSVTNPKAILTPDPEAESASARYKVYLNIEFNDYEYTTVDNKMELMLKITDPQGNEITETHGLTYKTESGVSGFDVTTRTGLFLVADEFLITTTDNTPITDEWDISISMISLETNQELNYDKTFTAKVILTQQYYAPHTILENNGGVAFIEERSTNPETAPDFSQIANTDEGMFMAPDDYGNSYYFRGAVDDNWVYFANIYWRIVRINGDGSIRMIYAGTTEPTYAERISRSASIGTINYQPGNSISEHVGYMYEVNDSRGLDFSSALKTSIDNWYATQIENEENRIKIADTLFCNDRTVTSGTGVGSGATTFNGYTRLVANKDPVLTCENKNDRFTKEDEIRGNGALAYSAATITADEMMMAGYSSTINDNNYLNGGNYFTMTPYNKSTYAQIFVSTSNALSVTAVDHYYIAGGGFHTLRNIRPVINLKSETILTGLGTYDDVYKIKN